MLPLSTPLPPFSDWTITIVSPKSQATICKPRFWLVDGSNCFLTFEQGLSSLHCFFWNEGTWLYVAWLLILLVVSLMYALSVMHFNRILFFFFFPFNSGHGRSARWGNNFRFLIFKSSFLNVIEDWFFFWQRHQEIILVAQKALAFVNRTRI